jgi:hypothetical protein
MKQHLNTFSKGMNQDIDNTLETNKDNYRYALNGRITTEYGTTAFAFENVLGNEESVTMLNVANVVKITTTQGVVTDLLNAATYITINLKLNGSVYATVTLTDADPTWSDSFNSPKDFYAFIEELIQSIVMPASEPVYTYITDEGLFVTLKYGYDDLEVELLADADLNIPSDVQSEEYVPKALAPVIIGYTVLNDTFVIFTTTETAEDPTNSTGQIWSLDYDNVTLVPTLNLLYHGYINFSMAHLIQAVPRYENSLLQKVYWTDNHNYIRVFNIADSNGFVLKPDELNLFPSFNFEPAILQAVTLGGSLDVGTYQLSYLLKRSTGTSTSLARTSNVVSIYREHEIDNSVSNYTALVGEDYNPQTPVPTGKKIIWSVGSLDTSFNYMIPIIVKRTSYTSTPKVYKLDPIAVTSPSVTIDYSGLENAEEITIEEYAILSTTYFDKCKTLTTTANMLVAGNIQSGGSLDLKFDARAYRFEPTGDSYVIPDFADTETWGIPEEEDTIDPSTVPSTPTPGTPNYYWDFHVDHLSYKYQRDGVTIGGEGPNISYKFVSKELSVDEMSATFGSQAYIWASQPAPIARPKPNLLSVTETLNSYVYPASNTYLNHTTPYYSGLYRGYKRGEVYRFGIVFYDKRGNPGYTKWIADIKFPRVAENIGDAGINPQGTPAGYDTMTYVSTAGQEKASANQLGIEFTVNIPQSIADKITGYSIVRVKRELKDRTVVSNGLIMPYYDLGTEYALPSPRSTPGQSAATTPIGSAASLYDAARTGFKYISPEFQFSNSDICPSLNFASGADTMYIDHYLMRATTNAVDTCSDSQDFNYNKLYTNVTTVNSTVTNISPFRTTTDRSYYMPLVKAEPVAQGANSSYAGVAYKNLSETSSGSQFGSGAKGIFCVVNPVDGNTIQYSDMGASTTGNKFVGDYCKIIADQYGGNSYEARAVNEYISCGHYQRVKEAAAYTSTVFGGDTFVTLYDFTAVFPRDSQGNNWTTANNSSSTSFYFPVETFINTQIRHGNHYNNSPIYGVDTTSARRDEFLYNSVYSCENDILKTFPKPSDSSFNPVQEYPNRIYVSDKKVNGEATDSWAVFRDGNSLDVDGVNGPVNNLITYRDNVVSFQNSAIAVLNINPKFIVKDAIGTQEALLGTGAALAGYSYISTEIGTRHQWSVVKGAFGGAEVVYFFDVSKFKLFKFEEKQLQPVSDVKGMYSFFRENVKGSILTSDNAVLNKGIVGVYDYKNNELIMTFKTQLNSSAHNHNGAVTLEDRAFTIAYSEPLNVFTSFYSYTPSIYLASDSILLSPDPAEQQVVYMHNKGPFAQFYRTQYPTTVKFTVNPEVTERKVLSSIMFPSRSIMFDGNVDQSYDTVDRVRVNNTYQNTDWIELIADDTIARRERMWSLNELYDVVIDPDTDIYSPFNFISTLPATDERVMYPARLRDLWFDVEFQYDNTTYDLSGNNRKLVLPFVKSNYNTSAR